MISKASLISKKSKNSISMLSKKKSNKSLLSYKKSKASKASLDRSAYGMGIGLGKSKASLGSSK
jgi:hypothetical protein